MNGFSIDPRSRARLLVVIAFSTLMIRCAIPAEAQNEAELRLAVERARVVEQALRDELAIQQHLVDEGLASQVELRRARSRLEEAEIATEMARAALTAALPPVRLLTAVRRTSPVGQSEVALLFERTGRAAERFGQSVVVSVLSSDLVVGRPFQALLEFPAGGKPTASLVFDLIRDVDEITVVTVSGSRRDEIRVPLQMSSQGAPVRLSSLNSSQDGQLGETVDYDVVVERASPSLASVALEVSGLPRGFTAEILDQERRSRLRLLQFPQGVDRVPVVVRIAVPQQEDAAWSDRLIELTVHAVPPTANEPLASVVLRLRPVGRPELRLVSNTPGVEVAPGETVEIAVDVVNSGRVAAVEVVPRLAEPIGLRVTAQPSKITEIPAGEKAVLRVRATPRPEAVAGDYEVNLRVVTQQTGSYAESKDLTVRVTVIRQPRWSILGLGLTIIAALGTGGLWLRRRVSPSI